jgi:23S rRNA (pseudouridine1915-N3)-methyltransferase
MSRRPWIQGSGAIVCLPERWDRFDKQHLLVIAGGRCYNQRMGLQLLTVGKARQDGLAATGKDYLARLSHYTRIEESIVREERTTKGTRPEDVMRQEGLRIAGLLKPECFVISLDRNGKTVDSEGLASKLRELADTGRDATFVIGGAWGLSPEILRKSDWTWSLSTLTYPHELARVVVLEQLYRAHTILRGEPYHK